VAAGAVAAPATAAALAAAATAATPAAAAEATLLAVAGPAAGAAVAAAPVAAPGTPFTTFAPCGFFGLTLAGGSFTPPACTMMSCVKHLKRD
jgi:hypothetical protein